MTDINIYLGGASVLFSIIALVVAIKANKKSKRTQGAHNALAKDYDATEKKVDHLYRES